MGIMELPNNKYERWLTISTLVDGAGYIGFAPFVYFVKIGYVWHDAGPILGFPIVMQGYLNMILCVYFVVGLFLLRIAQKGVRKYPAILSLNAWALQFAHLVAMCGNMLVGPFEGNPAYVLYGIPANFWPFGDVWFMAALCAINVYLLHKVFNHACPL
jgi:hypothetical protein